MSFKSLFDRGMLMLLLLWHRLVANIRCGVIAVCLGPNAALAEQLRPVPLPMISITKKAKKLWDWVKCTCSETNHFGRGCILQDRFPWVRVWSGACISRLRYQLKLPWPPLVTFHQHDFSKFPHCEILVFGKQKTGQISSALRSEAEMAQMIGCVGDDIIVSTTEEGLHSEKWAHQSIPQTCNYCIMSFVSESFNVLRLDWYIGRSGNVLLRSPCFRSALFFLIGVAP